jgi:aminodeoxyfutalosine synthase
MTRVEHSDFSEIAVLFNVDDNLKQIAQKVISGLRISSSDCLDLYTSNNLGFLGFLADTVRKKHVGDYAFFNKNFHIEPTNICIYNCKFCSYSRKINDSGSWECDLSEIEKIAESYIGKDVTEVHIVGGVHPQYDIEYYAEMIRKVRNQLPDVHIKAFSAVELDFMFKKTGIKEGFSILKKAGLNSIPGGGAEIFDKTLRSQICPEKVGSEGWLKVHETAHTMGIGSNATMLYGHVETYEHRVDHLNRLRQLQDKTGGFNCFIPLKFKRANNPMSDIPEITLIEDLKNYAVSRIFLDNFKHLKAYWPAIGKDIAQLSLSFGVDDIDGTIDDTTKIYTMAGADDKKTAMSTNELVSIIRQSGRIPAERDSLYQIIREF